MRSRKLSPGCDVTRTTIRSDSTRVPPVTPLWSVPASRITGALSPVMALSSTAASPSMTSPSPGIISPACTTITSPRRSWVLGTTSSRPSSTRRAGVSSRAERSVAACAFPRASASPSAKFANTTVNSSKTVTPAG